MPITGIARLVQVSPFLVGITGIEGDRQRPSRPPEGIAPPDQNRTSPPQTPPTSQPQPTQASDQPFDPGRPEPNERRVLIRDRRQADALVARPSSQFLAQLIAQEIAQTTFDVLEETFFPPATLEDADTIDARREDDDDRARAAAFERRQEAARTYQRAKEAEEEYNAERYNVLFDREGYFVLRSNFIDIEV